MPTLLASMVIAMVIANCPADPWSSSPTRAIPVIFDTDIESDVDDAGAVAVLHALADAGELRILGMGVSAAHYWSAPCLDALNTYYRRPDLPIGVVKSAVPDNGSKYARGVAAEFPHSLKSPQDAPDAALLYRELLARAKDRSVVVISVGFLTNLSNLLKTGPDAHSPLGGVDLVKRKVRAWVCMGGAFPQGREWNVHRDASASLHAINNWPTPIVFSGFEIGAKIKTGSQLAACPKTNPVRRCYELYNGLKDRESWDLTAVLYAARGWNEGLKEVWSEQRGRITVLPDGSNIWSDDPAGRHTYLIEKMAPARVKEIIESLMVSSAG